MEFNNQNKQEKFPIDQILCTIQGEGKHIGVPALLIRTKGCNLSCSFCDSKRTWVDKNEIFITHKNFSIIIKEIVERIHELNYIIKCLILTGGEPTLHFSNFLYRKFITNLCHELDIDYIEIETNGAYLQFQYLEETIKAFENAVAKKIVFNISPKIDSDIELVTSNLLWANTYSNDNNKMDFGVKLVNTPEIIELFETKILPLLSYFDIGNIYVMPLTTYKHSKVDYNQYIENCHETIEFCLKRNYRYTPREHIWIFGKNINEHKLIV